jgi:hypothetical protein
MPSMGHHNLIILFAIDTKINPDTHGARYLYKNKIPKKKLINCTRYLRKSDLGLGYKYVAEK